MKVLRCLCFLICMFIGIMAHAQDTFYVKKNTPRETVVQSERAPIDSSENDSIVSYTMQYKKANSNIWIVRHEKGPQFVTPMGSEYDGRILFSDIIAVDKNGVKYRKPDKYYTRGIWVEVPRK